MFLGHVTLADHPNPGIDYGTAGSGQLLLQNSINGLSAFGFEEGDVIFWAS